MREVRNKRTIYEAMTGIVSHEEKKNSSENNDRMEHKNEEKEEENVNNLLPEQNTWQNFVNIQQNVKDFAISITQKSHRRTIFKFIVFWYDLHCCLLNDFEFIFHCTVF